MSTEANNSKAIYFVAAIIVAALIFAGVRLIIQSNDIYQTSLHYTEVSIKDSVLKTRSSLTPNYTSVKDGYTEALLYFTLALGVVLLAVLLPRLQNINIGTSGINLTLKDLPQKVDALIKQTNAIQSSSAGEGGIKKVEMKSDTKEEGLINFNLKQKTEEYSDDPQKGKWGGLALRNNRKLSAVVIPSALPYLYKVTLTVESTSASIPLKGLVRFHLHNSFLNPDPIISMQDGKAVLRLSKVYGAFTVGAEADDGQTLLELDLAEDKSFPKEFRER